MLLQVRNTITNALTYMPNNDNNRENPPPYSAGGQPPYPGYPPYPYLAPADDEIDLRELWNAVWQGKWIIVGVTAVFAIASVLYALSLPNVYQAKALLAPSEDAQGGGMSRMVGQLGGLASLAGISMGGTAGNDKVAVAMAVLKSRKFISNFVEQQGILPELMAVERWDAGTNTLVFDSELYDVHQGKWNRGVEPPKTAEPSEWEVHKKFMGILTVSQDSGNGFVTVAVEHQSPFVAERLVRLLVDNVNEVMKEKDVTEALRSIEFLQDQLSGVALADMRTVFYQLIEEQTKTVMLAKVRDEYVFTTIDPPVVPEERVRPKRALICVLGTMLGGMFGILLVIIRHFMRGDRFEKP